MSELTTRSAFPLPLLNEFGLVVPKTWLIANKSPKITHFAFIFYISTGSWKNLETECKTISILQSLILDPEPWARKDEPAPWIADLFLIALFVQELWFDAKQSLSFNNEFQIQGLRQEKKMHCTGLKCKRWKK